MRALLAQLVRFGLVGAVGLVIDVGVFNLLRITVLAPESVQHGPLYAKLISTSLATSLKNFAALPLVTMVRK